MNRRSLVVYWIGLLAAVLVLVPAVPALPSRAQSSGPAWLPTTLSGGQVRALATHPATPDRFYALLTDTGPFRSDDGGSTWTRVADGLPFKPEAVRLYYALAVDPADPDRVFLGIGASNSPELGRVYRSVDAGASWQPAGNGLPTVEVNALVIDPQHVQTVYAATSSGLYRTIDGGSNWQAIGHSGQTVWSVDVDPGNSAHILALVGDHVYASTDSGATWHDASAGLPLPSGVTPSARIAFDPSTPQTAYLTGLIVDGCYRSSDGGETWSALNDGLNTTLPTLTALAISASAPTRVHVATMEGLYRLDDDQWTLLSTGLADDLGTFPDALAQSPGSGAYLLGAAYGLVRSVDGGQTWNTTGPGLTGARIEAVEVDPSNGARVFASTGNRLYRSADTGNTWTAALPRDTGRGFEIAVDPYNTNHVYFSIHLAPLRHSLDGGVTWNPVPNETTIPYDVREIRFHSSDPLRRYLAGPHNFSSHTTAQGVYRSVDGGQNWEQVKDYLRAVELALSADGNTLYAASISQLYRSTDAGDTWALAENGLPQAGRFIHGLEAHPGDPSVAWMAMGGAGVFRTTDRGTSWQPFNDGLPGGYLTDIKVRSSNGSIVLYAATRYGVYVSRAGGSWELLGSGLPEYAQWTNSLAVTDSGRVYVGTDFGGLWTLQDIDAPPPPDSPCSGIPLGSGRIWLAETGFAVQGLWYDWYHSHGGLDIFGLPRSPVTPDPLNPSQCVQYFQRGVLEWHPQNPEPWRIQRRLMVDIMMPGIDPEASPAHGNGGDYWYFLQTKHAVSNYAPNGQHIGFKWFFDRFGREDTFGYPLEEPKLRRGTDGVTRWTQRFQAAMFEYHAEYDIPGNKPGTDIPWRNWIVLLGLLGDQYIAEHGLDFGVICPQPPMLGFGKIWHDDPRLQQRLLCPRAIETGTAVVEQPFQHGWMFRRDDTDQIYVLLDTGQWNSHIDTWHPGEPEIDPSISVPSGVYQPRQGLGKVWRALSHPPLYNGGGLYWGIEPDRAFRGSVQPYEHGTMIWSDRRVIYVLYDDGTWTSYLDFFGQ